MAVADKLKMGNAPGLNGITAETNKSVIQIILNETQWNSKIPDLPK